ncbi:MAG: hypothetical protein GY757_21565 [bacterium]|nr:hypothetical protein [bacterium]
MTTDKQENAAKKEPQKSKYDSAWKKVIRELFKDFFEFFFPEIHNAIDFTKEVEFLDKELKEIDPDSSLGDRVADVLVKVHLKDKSTKYIGIITHVEVHGDPRSDFMERMFIYYYRAADKEKKDKIPVISVAILTDDRDYTKIETKHNNKINEHSFSCLGFELNMKIPMVKTSDYKNKKALREKLKTSKNPMAMVVKAQLKSHEVKQSNANKRYVVVKELIRECYKMGYSKKKTHIILKFFDWVIRLPDAYKKQIKIVIKEAEEENKMEYVATWERDWLEEGIIKGEKKGRKEGKKEGITETAKNMLKEGLPLDIIQKCTGLSKAVINKLSTTSH